MEREQREKGLEFMQPEIESAIPSLATLFPITPEELESFDRPRFDFDQIVEGCWLDEEAQSGRENIILMLPKGITKYRIGRVVGSWFYQNTNPKIFQESRNYARQVLPKGEIRKSRETGKPLQLNEQASRIIVGYNNLKEVIEHYCGLYHNQEGAFSSEDASDLIGKVEEIPEEDTLEKSFAELQKESMYRGRQIAEKLYGLPPDKFRPLAKDSFEEVGRKLRLLTSIDVLE